MTDWTYQFVLLKDGKKEITTVYDVVSDSMLNDQKGFIIAEGVQIPVARNGQEGELHIWQESSAPHQDAHSLSLNIGDLFSITTNASDTWCYRATLRGTTFGASSRYSEHDAVKNASQRVIEALDGSYNPLLLSFRGHNCVVWRDPDDRWGFTSLIPAITEIYHLEARVAGCTSRADAERQARLSLAWEAWDGKEETSPLLLEADDQKWFTHYIRQQKQKGKQKTPLVPDPIVLQIHDPLQADRVLSLVLRQHPDRLVLEAYPRLHASDEPWFDAVGAIAIKIYDNALQVQLYDQVGIEKDRVHWQLPAVIGEGCFVLAENIDGSDSQEESSQDEKEDEEEK